MDVSTVALYMRLSREDDDVKDESNSISNQRKLRSLRTAPSSSMWTMVTRAPVLKDRVLWR